MASHVERIAKKTFGVGNTEMQNSRPPEPRGGGTRRTEDNNRSKQVAVVPHYEGRVKGTVRITSKKQGSGLFLRNLRPRAVIA